MDLVCFTNCLLVLQDGSLVARDLWIDQHTGLILDAQKTFFERRRRPDTTIDLGGNILSPGFIDVQINGAYGFDFSVFDGNTAAYRQNLAIVAKRIVETGVTSFVPTIITQQSELYPKLLPLLAPNSTPASASILGFHAEGPFLQPAKRGAHMSPYLLSAPAGFKSFETLYGASSLARSFPGVRIITAAPEIEGVLPAMEELTSRGIICSIGHSIASSEISTTAVRKGGARLITHLFNAMPQLHHRDPSIIGLLGAAESGEGPAESGEGGAGKKTRQFTFPSRPLSRSASASGSDVGLGLGLGSAPVLGVGEAIVEGITPPQTPPPPPSGFLSGAGGQGGVQGVEREGEGKQGERERERERGGGFEKPYYGIIVDGVHSHPHSVRLAYTAHREGCILVTDAMPLLDPHLKDGTHPWRDGRRLVKEGVKLYVEGTDTLAGSVVSMDTCIRNLANFTGCTIGEAIKCATYNPAACLKIPHKKGTLQPGADADLVVLDARGYVMDTWVGGRHVWGVGGVDGGVGVDGGLDGGLDGGVGVGKGKGVGVDGGVDGGLDVDGLDGGVDGGLE